LTKYGKDVVLRVLSITLIIDGIAYFIDILWLKILLLALSFIFFGFTLYFFRDPDRKLPEGISENIILSPADGKIVLISEVVKNNNEFFNENEKLKQISIFLSPLNVHVNRIPITGVVKHFQYIKGDYVVAFNHKSSEKNERTEIGIIDVSGKKILFKQIAGYVARRIVCELTVDRQVKRGERFGMIKFGSRVDILINADSEIKVEIGQKVRGGETIIAGI